MEHIFDETVNSSELIKITIDKLQQLRLSGAKIQAQPLGMMRIALDGQRNADCGMFLHFWAANLPKSMSTPPIHTHVFDLKSRIILGEIRDTILKPILDSDGAYQLVKSRCAQEHCTITNKLGRANLKIDTVREFSPGDIYEIPKGNFHVTSPQKEGKIAITIMEKYRIDDEDPILAIPHGDEINTTPFNRLQLNQELAWKTIMGSLNKKTSSIERG